MSLPKRIGLIGLIGSGKTTAAHWLRFKYGYKRICFADPLKNMLVAFGVDPNFLTDPIEKSRQLALLEGRTPRHAMQTLGTEWGRNCIGPNVWVNAWTRMAIGKYVVADDLRFENELNEIRSNGKVILIRRPGTSPEGHISEHLATTLQPSEVDATISNDGTISEFEGKLTEVMNYLSK